MAIDVLTPRRAGAPRVPAARKATRRAAAAAAPTAAVLGACYATAEPLLVRRPHAGMSSGQAPSAGRPAPEGLNCAWPHAQNGAYRSWPSEASDEVLTGAQIHDVQLMRRLSSVVVVVVVVVPQLCPAAAGLQRPSCLWSSPPSRAHGTGAARVRRPAVVCPSAVNGRVASADSSVSRGLSRSLWHHTTKRRTVPPQLGCRCALTGMQHSALL